MREGICVVRLALSVNNASEIGVDTVYARVDLHSEYILFDLTHREFIIGGFGRHQFEVTKPFTVLLDFLLEIRDFFAVVNCEFVCVSFVIDGHSQFGRKAL